jgi:RES domain-containing protein
MPAERPVRGGPGALDSLLRPWQGTAIRHIPAGSPYHVLDTRFAALARDNRWNEAGSPTIYAAGDLGVAVAEFGRHLVEARDVHGRHLIRDRAIYRLEVRVSAMLDLRDPIVGRAIGLRGGARRFVDVSVARATANYARFTTPAQALLVPSIAFLDDLTRWNLVLFLEKLPPDLSTFVAATYDGIIAVEPPAPRGPPRRVRAGAPPASDRAGTTRRAAPAVRH